MAQAEDSAPQGGTTARRAIGLEHEEQLAFPGFANPLDRVRRRFIDLRSTFPELRRELTWNGARAILKRLGIPIEYAPLPHPAALITDGDAAVLVLSSSVPPRRHTYFVAHELAHYFLHAPDDPTPCFRMDPDWGDHDPREDEAEYLAMLMLGGRIFHRYL